MKEEPGTKFYFDGKIARVVFKEDVERKIYWFDATKLYHRGLHNYFHNYFHHIPYHRLLPIEEWLKEQGMICVEDDLVLFAMRWG